MADKIPVPRPRPKDWKRFMDKVQILPSGCWEWKAARFKQGYGIFYLDGKLRRAHRVLYVWTWGEVGVGDDLDHVCRNRACVNPEHLEVVTRRENVLRGEGHTARNSRKTHCDHGHAFTQENTIIDAGGWRQCRTCVNRRAREYADRNRDEINRKKREKRGKVSYDPRPCEECGEPFTPKRSDSRFCSVSCQAKSARRVRLGRT